MTGLGGAVLITTLSYYPLVFLPVSAALRGLDRSWEDTARSLGLGRWRTVVRFEQTRFQGRSFELALVMADRLARGREFLPRGRIIASGASAAWHAGQVDTVDGCAPKSALIARHAVAGDRVLLPAAWAATLAPEFGAMLRARGASLACIDRIGII